MELKGKKILVIGASRGIGEAIASACGRAGAELVITGRKQETIEAAAEKIRSEGCRVSPLVWDVANVRIADEKIAEADRIMGGLDVVIHNAGVIDSERFLAVREEGFDRVFDVNVKGLYFAIQAAANHFLEKKDREIKGKITVISSETGHEARVMPYGISKWSVMGMCLGFAKRLFPKGIIVQNIAPGPVTTDMMKWKEGDSDAFPSSFLRMAKPEEIAELAVFLASDRANRIAGQPIYINGGLWQP